MAEGLTTALDPKKPPVNDLCMQGAQTVLTLKKTYTCDDSGVLKIVQNNGTVVFLKFIS
jgi:hypothetical protein